MSNPSATRLCPHWKQLDYRSRLCRGGSIVYRMTVPLRKHLPSVRESPKTKNFFGLVQIYRSLFCAFAQTHSKKQYPNVALNHPRMARYTSTPIMAKPNCRRTLNSPDGELSSSVRRLCCCRIPMALSLRTATISHEES